jgi:hypothetical protein
MDAFVGAQRSAVTCVNTLTRRRATGDCDCAATARGDSGEEHGRSQLVRRQRYPIHWVTSGECERRCCAHAGRECGQFLYSVNSNISAVRPLGLRTTSCVSTAVLNARAQTPTWTWTCSTRRSATCMTSKRRLRCAHHAARRMVVDSCLHVDVRASVRGAPQRAHCRDVPGASETRAVCRSD